MKKILIALVAIIIGAAVYGLYPPLVKKRQAAAVLDQFAATVATKDRAKIGAFLTDTLADDAKIHLEAQVFSISQPDNAKPILQDFDKPAFIAFVDNILFSMTDYDYAAELADFTLGQDGHAADLRFTSQEWADGPEHYAGVAVNMRFSSNTECDGHVQFQGKAVRMDNVSCVQHLRMVPKPGEAIKMQQNPEVLQHFLRPTP